MRNPNRINLVMSQLEIFWHAFPDLRFGQLVDLVKLKTEEFYPGQDFFYMEDDKIQEVLAKINAESFKFKRV